MVSTRFLVTATVGTVALAGCSTMSPSATAPNPDRLIQTANPTTVKFTAEDIEAMRKALPQQLSAEQAKRLVKIDPSKIVVPDRSVQVRGFHRGFGGFGGFGRFGGLGRFGHFGRFGGFGAGWGLGLGGFWPYTYGGYDLLWPYTAAGSIYSPYGYWPYGWTGGLLSPWII